MTTLIKLASACAAFAVIAAKAGWTDAYHVLISCAFAAIAALVTIGLKSRRSEKIQRRQNREPFLRSVFVGATTGALLAGCAGTVFFLLGRFPVTDAYYERGRPEVERVLAALELAGNYRAAAETIEQQLTQQTSKRWAISLRERLVKDLIRAARLESASSDKRHLLEKAKGLGAKFSLDTALADAYLIQLDYDEQHTSLAAQNERLASELAQREKKLIAAEFKSLLALGDAHTQLAKRQEYYALAKKLADSYRLDAKPAEVRLAQVAAAIEKNAPRSLPSTTRVRIKSVSSLPPIGILQLSVTDANGQHISGLARNDFRVLDKSGTRIPACAAEDAVNTSKLVNVAIAFDHSASMSGRPLEEAKRSLTATLAQLRGPTPIPVFGFSSTVRPITEIQSVVASGRTALYTGILQAARAIAGREGDNVLVLITDGRNTVNGPSLDDVIGECRRAQIAVHVVALQTPELDERVLRRIATETGGTLAVRDVSSLAAAIKNAAAITRTPFYRLVVPFDALQRSQLRIEVGAGGRVSAACDTLVALHH